MAYYNYESGDDLVKDWHKLRAEYQEKLYKYIKKMLQIQRLESRMDTDIYIKERPYKTAQEEGDIRCSFCGRHHNEISKMIASPDYSYICNECVETCKEILDEEYNKIDSDME